MVSNHFEATDDDDGDDDYDENDDDFYGIYSNIRIMMRIMNLIIAS